MLGVWIAPVTAQLMMTLAMAFPLGIRRGGLCRRATGRTRAGRRDWRLQRTTDLDGAVQAQLSSRVLHRPAADPPWMQHAVIARRLRPTRNYGSRQCHVPGCHREARSAVAIPFTVRTIGRSPRRERLAMTGVFIQGRSAAGRYRTRDDNRVWTASSRSVVSL